MLRRKIFDILADFEVSARWDKAAKAYYCELCTEGPGPGTFFPDRESLWADHCFEPLLEWVNTQLTDDVWIGYYRVGRGSTYVALGTLENLDILGDPSSQVALFKAVLDDQSAGATDNLANETSTAT